jgi:uncharacterized protein YybS (DUF2232 family)
VHAVQQHQISRNIIAGVIITLLLALGVVASWLVPLPMVFYRSKLGRKSSLIIPAVVVLMLLMLSRGFTSWLMVTSGLMFLGFLLYECFELRLSIEKTILFSCIIVMVSGCLALIFYSNVTQTGVYDLAYAQTRDVINQFQQTGLITEAPEDLIRLATLCLPGIITSMILFIAWINVVIAIPLLKRNQLYVPDFGPLVRWKAPDYLVWCAIAGIVGMLSTLSGLDIIGLNVLCILAPIYFFQGISVISFFLNKISMPLGLKALLYWLVFFQVPVNILVTGIGFFDIWVDFRSRAFFKKKEDPDDY